ncbi:MAG: hypothetical protein IPG70_15425 [Moraxellaceae bacterium]|nr:hypothetical protein [Moraxellaceae bacterium]
MPALAKHAIICAHDSRFVRLFCQESPVIHGLIQQLARHVPHHPLLQHLRWQWVISPYQAINPLAQLTLRLLIPLA